MSMIYCNVDMFSAKATIMDEQGKAFAIVDVDKIDSMLPQFCYSKGIETIHFIGLTQYVDALINNIQIQENITYGINKLRFEVN